MPDEKDDGTTPEPRFAIPLPGGRVARVPFDVLEQYVDEGATAVHGINTPGSAGQPQSGHPHTKGGGMITINIYADSGKVTVDHASEQDDVVAHSLAIDPATGTSDWHPDWEFGECEYTDEAGFPQTIQAWHRHPFGTEYTELYEA